MTRDTIRIYVACLASYNSGILHGTWIDATQDADANRAEEWASIDYEVFYSTPLSEWAGFDQVVELAEFIQKHGALAGAVLAHFSGDLEEAIEDNYCGAYESLADYAQELTEETTTIPEPLQHYIDYDTMACDMELSGDVFTIEASARGMPSIVY